MQMIRMVKTTLKTNKFAALALPVFKCSYKITVIKIVYYWHKDIIQWNGIENPNVYMSSKNDIYAFS